MFANFFFSGSSAAVLPPVADFTGTPTSGTFPLTVAFTDTSTNTPTSWAWYKNDGSGEVPFDGTPTVQNPTEDFAEGSWTIKLIATNAGGSDPILRVGYITANPPPSNLDELSDYLFLVRPGDDAAANRLWTDLAKTTNATAAGQHVLVASAPVSPLSPPISTVDLAKLDSTARLQLGVADGVTYLEVIGSNPGDDPILYNNTVLTTIGSGPLHGFIWFNNPSDGNDIAGALESYNDISLRINIVGSAAITYRELFSAGIAPGTFAADAWQLVQIFLDTDTSEVGIKGNDHDPIRVAATPGDISNNFSLIGLYGEAGGKIGPFAFRNVIPSDDEMNTVWMAGPTGDGSNWPPPLALTATLLYSGEIVQITFPQNFVLGTGDPLVGIDGTDVTCVRVYQPIENILMIRIPPANIVTSSSTVVTVTLPQGLVSLGHTTNHAVTNNTNVETLLPTEPPVNAGDILVGNNFGQPVYFTEQTAFANAASMLSAWGDFGGTATYGTNGLPLTITGGIGYLKAVLFIELPNPWQTGDYLIRWKGAGSAALVYNFNTLAPVVSSGTAGGWNYQVATIADYNGFGLAIFGTPPLTDLQLILPGNWNTGTHLPSTVVDSDWASRYGQHAYMRNMGWFYVNDSNLRYITDYLPDGYYTQGYTVTRSASGTIISATSTTSAFIGLSSTCYLITHAIPGDPFHTGDVVNTGGLEWLVERVNSTQYKALAFGSAPTGAIDFIVPSTGIIEEICRYHSELNQGMWFNIPHMMDDTGVSAIAAKVLSLVTAGIPVRVELSNECWNFGFKQTFYFDGLGRVNGTSLQVEYARRTADVHQLFYVAFNAAGRAADLIRVVAWHPYDSAAGKIVLDAYKARCVSQGYSFTAPHEYATTNYFSQSDPTPGSDTLATRFRDFLMNGSDDPVPLTAAGLVDMAVYALLDGAVGTLAAATAAADMITQWNSDNTALVRNTTYEGSQSMSGAEFSFSGKTSGDGPNYAGTNGLDGAGLMMNLAFARANRHPRIGNAQYGSIKQCLDLGYSAWSQLGSQGLFQRYGYWSDAEYFNQPLGNGESNLADLDNIVGAECPKLYAEIQWIEAS